MTRQALTRTAAVAVAAILLVLSGCGSMQGPRIGVLLPEEYNTPDGMVLAPDGHIYLSVPNCNDERHPAKIVRISPDDQVDEVVTVPIHPETGKAAPLGIDVGPDGHLYVADNQGMWGRNDHKSRLLRIRMQDGRAVGAQTLVEGMVQANAVCCRPDGVYVTETVLDPDLSPMPSGVYRFGYDEFKGQAVRVQPYNPQYDRMDPHLIAVLHTSNPDWRVGANGMGFDSEGSMYVCNFGQASILKYRMDARGNVRSVETLAKGQGMMSTDGIKLDEDDNIYVADYVGNAVHKVDTKNGLVTTLWANHNNSGGADGLLDRPSEVCLRGDWIYISNIDLPGQGNEYDAPHTISVLPKR